jgi:hypothetical protein
LLHQHQRQVKVLEHGHPPHAPDKAARYIEVTLDDIALANELVPEVLGRSLDELPPQTRRLLGHIRELVKSRRPNNGSAPKAGVKMGAGFGVTGGKMGPGDAWFSRRELRQACGWSLTQLRVHLERLVELEYLAIRHGRLGSPFVYELLIDTTETVAHVGLIDVATLRVTHDYKSNLTGFEPGVAGNNPHLAGGDGVAPSGANAVAGVR